MTLLRWVVEGGLGLLILMWIGVGTLWVYAKYWDFRLWLSERALKRSRGQVAVAEAEFIIAKHLYEMDE